MIIGIPHYNDFEGLKECVDSFRSSTNQLPIIYIINADRKHDKQFEYLSEKYIDLRIINIENKGPLYAYNHLFKIAKERKEDLFFTQTDVFFPKCKKDWLYEMQEVAKRPSCGMITCWGGGGVSGPDFINGYNWIGAWCTYIPYKVIEKVGAFDENMPLGYAVDIDYTYAVQQAGFINCVIDYWVHHMPNYEKNHQHEKVENIEELKKEAYRYMREKWKVGEYNVMD